MQKRKKELRGIILVELLLWFSLSTLLFSVLLSQQKTLLLNFFVLKNELKEIMNNKDLAHRLIHAVITSESHRLNTTPRIHDAVIRYLDSTPHEINFSHRSPQQGSTALTYLGLSLKNTLLIEHEKQNAHSFTTHSEHEFKVCTSQKDFKVKDIRRSGMLLGATGIYEVTVEKATVDTTQKQNRCYRIFAFIPERSMSAHNTPFLEFNAEFYIPITEHATLYQHKNRETEKSTIRYLHHRGTSIVENQPLFEYSQRLLLNYTQSENLEVLQKQKGTTQKLMYLDFSEKRVPWHYLFLTLKQAMKHK